MFLDQLGDVFWCTWGRVLVLETLLRVRFFCGRVSKKKKQLVEGWRISPLESKNRDLRGGEIDATRSDLH